MVQIYKRYFKVPNYQMFFKKKISFFISPILFVPGLAPSIVARIPCYYKWSSCQLLSVYSLSNGISRVTL